MIGRTIQGELTYFSTQQKTVEITDWESESRLYKIGWQTTSPSGYGLQDLIGKNVEAIEIDGVIKRIVLLPPEI